ncbi:unnamed protein product [Adineta steineri]|uniref:Uncharacterized protein n=1 Tax=Adineta steineri TaxID=433720 RepID=A0A815MP01_9BILA|nr:unnamed protein product [Adineta steineri]CAF4150852.1 unnamed protein product [Adineta steineri]
MMRTSRITPDYYYKPKEFLNRNNTNNNSYVIPNKTGHITNRSKYGQYNITEKDFGDHKISYYIPSEYENNYDISQLDENPISNQTQRIDSPILVRRRYYRHYDNNNNNNDYSNKELPIISSRQNIYIRSEQPKIIKRVYFKIPPSPKTIQHIYEDEHQLSNEDIIEYVVPQQQYVEEAQPIHHPVYVENLPSISRSPPVPPRQHLPQVSPTLSRPPVKTSHVSEFATPNYPKIIPRTTINETSPRSLPPIHNKQKHISLKEVLAQNRARRGSRIPIPRREIDEEVAYDLPIYNKNYVKNGFIVHK